MAGPGQQSPCEDTDVDSRADTDTHKRTHTNGHTQTDMHEEETDAHEEIYLDLHTFNSYTFNSYARVLESSNAACSNE